MRFSLLRLFLITSLLAIWLGLGYIWSRWGLLCYPLILQDVAPGNAWFDYTLGPIMLAIPIVIVGCIVGMIGIVVWLVIDELSSMLDSIELFIRKHTKW